MRSRRLRGFSPYTAVSYEVLTRWISQLGVLEVTGSMPGFVNTHDWSTCHHFVKARAVIFFCRFAFSYFFRTVWATNFVNNRLTTYSPTNEAGLHGEGRPGAATRGPAPPGPASGRLYYL